MTAQYYSERSEEFSAYFKLESSFWN